MKKLLALLLLCSAASAFAAGGPIRWEKLAGSRASAGQEFDLGFLSVPENRNSKSSRLIEVAFVRLKSKAEAPRSPIVFLNGGPGQPATPAVLDAQFLRALDALRNVGDVILLDQRGIGRSRPLLDCNEKLPLADAFTDTTAALDARVAALKRCASGFARQGFDLSGYNTRESAHDVNDLRDALGAGKISLLGFSYGTHLALSVVREHPGIVDRVVLVGTEGPDHTWKLPATLDTQFAKIASLAKAPDLVPALRRVLARAAREPYVVRVTPRGGDEMTLRVGRRGLRQLMIWDIGDSRDFVTFPALVRQLDAGSTDLLSAFVAKRLRRVAGTGNLMGPLMDCASGISADRRAVVKRQAQTALFGNVMNVEEEKLCAAFPTRALDDTFRSPIISDVNALFVSGTMDSNTPPFQAEEVRWGFSRGKHLVTDWAGHEDLLTDAEVFGIIVRYLGGDDSVRTNVARPVPRID